MNERMLTREQRAAAGQVFDSGSKRFTDLVRAAGLDPARDLRGAMLCRIVVQPKEDLSGWDFTGADLSGAVLRRVDLSGAILTDAQLDGADLRGAALPTGVGTLISALPPALHHGPNRLWPQHLEGEVNRLLSDNATDDDLFLAVRGKLNAGRPELAEHLYQALLDWRIDILEQDHPNTLITRHNLAHAVLDQGRAAEAEAAFRALLAVREKVSGAEHLGTLITRQELARAILNQGRAAEAEVAFRALLQVREKVSGPESPSTLITRISLANAVLAQGRAEEAEAMYRSLLLIQEKVSGPEDPTTLATRHNLGCAILAQGRTAGAVAAFRDLLPVRERVLGADHPFTLTSRQELARANLESGDAGRAADVLAMVPDDGGSPELDHIGDNHLTRAFLADLQGDATQAKRHLDAAEQAVSELDEASYTRRQLDHYRRTRTPGGAGGTTLWMVAYPAVKGAAGDAEPDLRVP
ncbi:MAG: tetratricopeptide repeat protein [Pikeienuella sp.]